MTLSATTSRCRSGQDERAINVEEEDTLRVCVGKRLAVVKTLVNLKDGRGISMISTILAIGVSARWAN